jgi:mono/diheme cytochrome c family protein
MTRWGAMALALALALSACSKKEEKADTAPPAEKAAFGDPKLQKGYEVFQYWCTPCHGAGPGHPGTTALEAKYRGSTPAVIEDRKDLPPDLTRYYVRNGVSIMPPFRKTEISDTDLDALAAYIARQR